MRGTLAIDLGSSTTVVAWQAHGGEATLLPIEPYPLAEPPVVPSLLWLAAADSTRPLIGRQVLAAVNLPPRRIGGFMSEVLVLGLPDRAGDVVLIRPDAPVPNGGRMH